MPPPKFHTLEDASRWATEHETQHTRERNEQREEFGTMLKAATTHIDGVAKKLSDDGAERTRKLEQIEKGQRRTNRYLRRADVERGMRRQRELDAESERKEAAERRAQLYRWGRWVLLPIALAALAALAKILAH